MDTEQRSPPGPLLSGFFGIQSLTMGILINLFLLFLALFSKTAMADNVILMIGDGMGQGIITATRAHYKQSVKMLNVDSLPYTALVRTHSTFSLIAYSGLV